MAARILAHHAHVFPASVNPNGTPDRLLKLLDDCRIDQAVCFAPFSHQLAGTGIDPNTWLVKEIASRPRLVGFGTIAFEAGALPEQVKRMAELGFKGIKLHPNVQEFDILSPQAMEVYAAAQAHGLFCTFHSGVHAGRLRDYDVLKFDEVAQHFPDLRLSLEHVGGYHFFPQALAVIVNRIPFPPVPGKRCRVFAGLTSIFTPDYNRFWYMPPDRLRELVLQAGVEQLIFGLDFPYNLEDATKLGLRTIRELGLPDEKTDLILGGNLRRELGIA